MHRVLSIDEILQNIFSRIKSRQTLYNLALVCRAFVEPANDALWRCLDGLWPLLRCLPQDVFQAPVVRGGPPVFAKAPEHSEWDSFRRHACRVRSLSFGDQKPSEYLVDEAALEMLKYHYPYPLLPSLTRLDWGDHELAQYLPVFTQKTLVEFSCSPVSEEELRLALHCIETSMPQLQKLTVKSDKLFAHFEMDEITHAISSLDHLTSLSFTYPPLPPDALVHLSRTAHLAEATLDLYQNNEDAHLSPAWGGFAALTKLTLGFARNIENYPCATTFLPRLAGVNLTKLSIVIRPTAHADEFNQLMSAVGHLTHLQECEICFDVIRVWGDLVLDGAALAPLYNLVNMRDFQVTWVPLTFSPQAVSDLTNAWRRLENLLLYAPAQSDYHLRLDSLAFFAENCPALHALTLRVAPVERDWRCAPDMGESASNLASLELQNSIIDPHAEDQVAEYLAKVFPIAAVGHKFWKARPDRAAAVMQRIHEREKGLVPQGRAGIEDKGRSEDGESE